MPLLESDLPHDPPPSSHMSAGGGDVEDGPYRQRTGSTGLRNLFRKRHKSSDPVSPVVTPPSKTPTSGNPHLPQAGTPGTPTSGGKVRHLFDTFRPRSKSDATSIPAPHHPQVYTMNHYTPGAGGVVGSHGSNGSGAGHLDSLNKSPLAGGSLPLRDTTPMSHLLANSHSQDYCSSPKGFTAEEFVEAYRERAYSDPKPRAKMAALAAKRAAYKKVGFVYFCMGIG
jgi:hypothetical protein